MEDVKFLIDNYDGKTYDLCYELLKSFENHAQIFEYTCNYYNKREKKKTIQLEHYYTDEEIEEDETIYGDTVNGLLNSNIKKCNLGIIAPDSFYTSLWASLCLIFSNIKEKAFAFYYILIDTTIPYQYLGKPLSMTNERYKELIEQNRCFIDKVKYIRDSHFSQRTERASLLLNCLEEIGDYESKTVVLSQAIQILSIKKSDIVPPDVERLSSADLEQLIKGIDKKIAELETSE